jgi:hypothetical protein
MSLVPFEIKPIKTICVLGCALHAGPKASLSYTGVVTPMPLRGPVGQTKARA